MILKNLLPQKIGKNSSELLIKNFKSMENFTKTNNIITTEEMVNESKKPVFKIIGDSLIIFHMRLVIKDVKTENIIWQNLIEKDLIKKTFKLNPNICAVDDLIFQYSNEKIIIDMNLQKHVFDSVEYNIDKNPWEQLKDAIKEMLGIDISNAKVKKLRFALFESIKSKNFFSSTVELPDFLLKYETERHKEFIRNDKQISYSIYSYAYAPQIINEEIVLKKNHELLKTNNYANFMNSHLEDDMCNIIADCRNNMVVVKK